MSLSNPRRIFVRAPRRSWLVQTTLLLALAALLTVGVGGGALLAAAQYRAPAALASN